jgi:hypothetical protein
VELVLIMECELFYETWKSSFQNRPVENVCVDWFSKIVSESFNM